jgi:hypothetical protein
MRSFVFLAASRPEIRTTSNNSSSSGRGSPECPADGKLPCACSPERSMDWKKQYERAIADGEIVVFVRDNEKEKLVSYSLPL